MGFEEFVKKAVKALNKSQIRYVIIGGIAAIFYGRPRTTMDLDMVVAMRKENIKQLCEFLRKEEFEAKEEEIESALKRKIHASIFLKNSPYRIDLKGVYSSLDEASLRRRKTVKIFGEKAWVEGVEDIIVAKLVYGSQQDLEDVKAILLRQKRLDKKYLRRRAKEEKVLKKLLKVMTWKVS